jgi:hypothetical protein
MVSKNGRLQELVRTGAVRKHPRTAMDSRRAAKGKPFRTFRLRGGVKIEKAVKSVR